MRIPRVAGRPCPGLLAAPTVMSVASLTSVAPAAAAAAPPNSGGRCHVSDTPTG
jgi:hypothetical protein